MIKQVECLRFIYECTQASQEIMLESNIQFSSQKPKDTSLLERAILVKFESSGDDARFKLNCLCRVIFSFESKESLVEDRALLQKHQADAYNAFRNLVNNTLSGMGKEKIDLPDIDFD